MPSNDNSPRLFVKSYFADSVEDAMRRARLELGSDPLLLNVRDSPPEARHLGECEVVFGVPNAAAPALPEAASLPALVDPVADLQKRMEDLQRLVFRISSGTVETNAPSRTTSLEDALIEAGVTRQLAGDIDAAVQQRLRSRGVIQIGRPKAAAGWTAEVMLREAVKELENRVNVSSDLETVTAFIGPPGVGKTSALVKLAVTRGLMAKRPVRLISIDHYRIAAADQLRTYASILGVPFTLVETPAGLAEAVDGAPAEALVLIDTPGLSQRSMEEFGGDLESFLASRQDIDIQLTLTASMRQADLQKTVDRFLRFRPSKLLFARMDETTSTSAVFCEAARTGLPLSFFSTGQMIPEDLEVATKARAIDSLVRELPTVLEAVA